MGKTTIASASALSLSDIYPEKRILLFSTDPAHSLSDCLGVVVREDVLSLKNNLYVQEMDAEKEYKKLKCLYSDEIKDIMTAFVKGDAAINVVSRERDHGIFYRYDPAWHRRGYGRCHDY